MLSEDLALVLNTLDKVLVPSIEAECPRHVHASARVCRDNLADVLDRLREYERAAAPALPPPASANVVPLRHRPKLIPVPTTPGGGDAA